MNDPTEVSWRDGQRPLMLTARRSTSALLLLFGSLACGESHRESFSPAPPPAASPDSPSSANHAGGTTIEYYRGRAQAAFAAGRLDEALRDLDHVLTVAPDDGRARLLRGRIRFTRAQFVEAQADLERAVEVLQRDPDALVRLAETHLQRRQFADAESLLLEASRVEPNNARTAARLALLYLTNDQPEKALPALERASALAPNDTALLVRTAEIYRKSGRLEESETTLSRARAISPKSPEITYELGVTLRQRGDVSGARQAFRQAVLLDPIHESAWYQLAQLAEPTASEGERKRDLDAYQRAKEKGDRERRIHSALENEPGHTEALFELAMLNIEHNRLEGAVELFQRIVAIDPRHLPAATNLGRAELRLGHPERALPAFQRALELAPTEPLRRLELAEALLAHGLTTEALAETQAVAVAAPAGDPRLQFALGELFLRLQHPQAAREAYDLALRALPANAEALAGRGIARAMLGDKAARQDLEAALAGGTQRAETVRMTLGSLGGATE